MKALSKKIESLYLHFPFCAHLCNYCDFYKKIPQDRVQDFRSFHQLLEQSFIEHEKLMKTSGYSWAPLKTLYIGGGTPSLWGIEGSLFLKNFLNQNNIALDKNCEFTLEVNPGSWSKELIDAWESVGVNRYSLGVQSLSGEMIKNLDRVHSLDDVFETLSFFSSYKKNFSVDFMLGLPNSINLKRDIIHELNEVLKYGPSHFSVYILTVKNNYVHYDDLPKEEWIEREYLEVADFLKSHNFDHYEVSNFSLKDKYSRHNLNYWKSSTVAALGPSATGFFSESKLRYKWKTKDATFEIENLTDKEFEIEKVYMGLRSFTGLDIYSMSSNKDLIDGLVTKWTSHSWAVLDKDNYIRLTSKGYLLLDSLINDLFSLKLL